MSYFPAFIKLDNKKILIIGGGNIAYEKLEHLLDFTNDIEVMAQCYSTKMLQLIEKHKLKYKKCSYKEGNISDFSVVVVAVDDIALQAKIFKESKKYNCLCNAVDSVDYCDFIFPAYVKKGDLTIAISTSGASPALAKRLKAYINSLMPHGISDFISDMKNLRKNLPKGKERMQMLDKKARDYILTALPKIKNGENYE